MSLASCCRFNPHITLDFADFAVDKVGSRNIFRDCGNLCFVIKLGQRRKGSTALGNTGYPRVTNRNGLGKNSLWNRMPNSAWITRFSTVAPAARMSTPRVCFPHLVLLKTHFLLQWESSLRSYPSTEFSKASSYCLRILSSGYCWKGRHYEWNHCNSLGHIWKELWNAFLNRCSWIVMADQ